MRVIFCADPLKPQHVDIDYQHEYHMAQKLGCTVELMSFEDLVDTGNPEAAVKRIKASPKEETAIYRGWMLKPDKYADLYHALKARHIELINSPASYRFCHYLPECYHVIKEHTPKTIWFSKDQLTESLQEVCTVLAHTFGAAPVVIKDYVKSRKHEWEEACFIPNASASASVKRVVNTFLERQGEDINEGLVCRAFIKLEFLAYHTKSHMPLTKEFRIFFLDGTPLQLLRYWDEGDYGELKPDLTMFGGIAKQVASRFFTMDIAKVENGGWVIIELGDGQVAGLPDHADFARFYRELYEKMPAEA